MLERYFKIKEHGSSVGTELIAGFTTFLTMAYILIVNPAILSGSGMPHGSLFTATAIGAIIGCILIALIANMPFALAPGMGINAFFVIVVVSKGYSWQSALTAVFISGILFFILSVFRIRESILRGFPDSLKSAVGVSLGLMIAAIGMVNAGILVRGNPNGPLISLGDVTQGSALLALIGLLITGLLLVFQVKGAMLVSIAITAIIGIPMGLTDISNLSFTNFIQSPPDISPIAFAFDFKPSIVFSLEFIVICFTFLFIDIFDNMGTFMGVLNRLNKEQQDTYNPRIGKALICDATAAMAGACFGTSTVTTYVESSTGVASGGRTGLTALTVATLFFLSLFFAPLFLAVPIAATAPAMIVVGMYLASVAVKINFEDLTDGLPAILTIMITTLTWSISDGLVFGWISYVFFKLIAKKFSSLNIITIVIAILFLLKIIFV